MGSNSATRLRPISAELAPKPKHIRAAAGPIGVIAGIREAAKPRNRLALGVGSALGGFVPIATYHLAHAEANWNNAAYSLPCYLVAGGLLYSATTVYTWMAEATGSGKKALGWTVLTEGVMIASRAPWLSIMALALLIGMNAVATGVRLAAGNKSLTPC